MNCKALIKVFMLVVVQILLFPSRVQSSESNFQDLSDTYHKDYPEKGKHGHFWSPIPIQGLFHANPGGFIYIAGWPEQVQDYAFIMHENAVPRENNVIIQPHQPNQASVKHGYVEYLSGDYLRGYLLTAAFIGFIVIRNRRP